MSILCLNTSHLIDSYPDGVGVADFRPPFAGHSRHTLSYCKGRRELGSLPKDKFEFRTSKSRGEIKRANEKHKESKHNGTDTKVEPDVPPEI